MITEYVLFSVPPGMTRDEVVQGMRDVVPKWRNKDSFARPLSTTLEQARLVPSPVLSACRGARTTRAPDAVGTAANRHPILTRHRGDNALGQTIEALARLVRRGVALERGANDAQPVALTCPGFRPPLRSGEPGVRGPKRQRAALQPC
jgi:hypothetical protein